MIKKKGRKPKSYYENLNNLNNTSITDSSINKMDYNENKVLQENKLLQENNDSIKIPKKRGRKPKGGVFVEEKKKINNNIPIPNIILHLKCKLNEINNDYNIVYKPKIENIDNYNIEDKKNNLIYNYIKNENFEYTNNKNFELLNNDSSLFEKKEENYILSCFQNNIIQDNSILNKNILQDNNVNNVNNVNNLKDKKNFNFENEKIISKKLKELSYNLKCNNIENKSDCFWCTYSYDNDTIIIPKYEINNKYVCYGSFCSPECACAYLMNDSSIDSSTKFERYYLLNNIYGKIYSYNKNIKPAPNPHYLLKKFNGNLDIQEYRKLLENERFLLVVDKPLTKVFPEIYEENDDFFVNCKTVTKNNYKLKRNS